MPLFIPSTPSTNTLLQQMIADGRLEIYLTKHRLERDLFTIYTSDQTDGRGQAGNHWESEPDKNLTFSTLFDIKEIPVKQQFLLCELVPVAIKNVLQPLITCGEIKIKWPNDIYFENKKLGGILIEHNIIDGKIDSSIAGIGLNINQTVFISDAPNPVSLKQITGKEYDLPQLLDDIIEEFKRIKPLMHKPHELKNLYMDSLYRRDDYYPYTANDSAFEARITDVADNGTITMTTRKGERRHFTFKEIKYVI